MLRTLLTVTLVLAVVVAVEEVDDVLLPSRHWKSSDHRAKVFEGRSGLLLILWEKESVVVIEGQALRVARPEWRAGPLLFWTTESWPGCPSCCAFEDSVVTRDLILLRREDGRVLAVTPR